MPTFAANLNDILKYVTPPESVKGFIKEATGSIIHPSNTTDGVLADYLADHNDGREHIVRKHLERVGQYGLGPEAHTMIDLQRQMEAPAQLAHSAAGLQYHSIQTPAVFVGHHTIQTGDGTVHLSHYQHPETGKQLTHAEWAIDHPDGGYGRRSYRAVLTPDEVNSVLKTFPQATDRLPVKVD